MRKISLVGVATASLLVGCISGIAGATASTTNSIYACLDTKGILTKVATKPHSCPKGTNTISWGVAGSVGPQGLPGPQGAQGLQGIQGERGLSGEAVAGLIIYGSVTQNVSADLVSGPFDLVTTQLLPEGNYYVNATAVFSPNLGGLELACWVNEDVGGSRSPTIFMNTTSESGFAHGLVHIPSGGSSLSFSCNTMDPSRRVYSPTLYAFKIAAFNPQ